MTKDKTKKEPIIHEFNIAITGQAEEPEYLKFGEDVIELKTPDQNQKREILNIMSLVSPRAMAMAPNFVGDELRVKIDDIGKGNIKPTQDEDEEIMVAFASATQACMLEEDAFNKIVKFVASFIKKDKSWIKESLNPQDVLRLFNLIVEKSPFEKTKTPKKKIASNLNSAFLMPFTR